MASLMDMEDRGRVLALELAGGILSRDKRQSILDVGCGSGWLVRRLTELYPGLEGWGVDPFGREQHHGRVHCIRAGAGDIASLGQRFDVVSTVMSLHHFPSVPVFLRQAAMVLSAESGRLLVVDWMRGVDTGIPEDYFSLQDIVGMLEDAGWNLTDSGQDTWHFFITARPPSSP